MEMDPAASNMWNLLLYEPAPMTWEIYSNLLSQAENYEVRPRIALPKNREKHISSSGFRPVAGRIYEDEEEAARVFHENLAKWEAAYPTIEPPAGAVSAKAATQTAMEACPVPFDRGQKPRVDLYHRVYHVTLYQHRLPKMDTAARVGSILVNAHTGEVVETRLTESVKRAMAPAVE